MTKDVWSYKKFLNVSLYFGREDPEERSIFGLKIEFVHFFSKHLVSHVEFWYHGGRG